MEVFAAVVALVSLALFCIAVHSIYSAFAHRRWGMLEFQLTLIASTIPPGLLFAALRSRVINPNTLIINGAFVFLGTLVLFVNASLSAMEWIEVLKIKQAMGRLGLLAFAWIFAFSRGLQGLALMALPVLLLYPKSWLLYWLIVAGVFASLCWLPYLRLRKFVESKKQAQRGDVQTDTVAASDAVTETINAD